LPAWNYDIHPSYIKNELSLYVYLLAWAEAYTYVPSGVFIHPGVWPQYTSAAKLGAAVPFFRGGGTPILHIVAWAEAYFRTKWRHDLSSRLATIDVPKMGGCSLLCPLFFGEGMGSWIPSNRM